MGFGKGKGFTSRDRTEMVEHVVKAGGGKATKTVTEATPTYATKQGGGKATKTITEANPTYTTSVS